MAKLSGGAITAIVIVAAGAVILMILTCALQMRKQTISRGTDASDRDQNQANYMRDVRTRGRELITGRPSRFGNSGQSQYARGGMGGYMTDSPDTSGYATPTYGNRWSGKDTADRERYSYNNEHARDIEQGRGHGRQHGGGQNRTDAPYHDYSGGASPEKGVEVTDHAYDAGQTTPTPAGKPVQMVEEHVVPESKH